MEAARLKPVEYRIDRGMDALPQAGSTSTGKAMNYPGGSVIGLPAPLVAATPKPVPAINSGKELANSMLGPSNKISNGSGKLYGGQPDNDKDDVPLNVEGTGTEKLASSFEKHLDAGRKEAETPSNEM